MFVIVCGVGTSRTREMRASGLPSGPRTRSTRCWIFAKQFEELKLTSGRMLAARLPGGLTPAGSCSPGVARSVKAPRLRREATSARPGKRFSRFLFVSATGGVAADVPLLDDPARSLLQTKLGGRWLRFGDTKHRTLATSVSGQATPRVAIGRERLPQRTLNPAPGALARKKGVRPMRFLGAASSATGSLTTAVRDWRRVVL